MSKSLTSIFITLLFLVSTSVSAQKYDGKQKDIDIILKNVENFSQYYMNADYKALANCYTADGKIFPNNQAIEQLNMSTYLDFEII